MSVALASPPDPTRLQLGDGRITTAGPTRGFVYVCSRPQGPSAPTGPWITGSTWSLTAKPTVDGSVTWPGRYAATRTGTKRAISGNDLPKHATGVFPIASTDDAYQYDRNPNSIASQRISLTVPAQPKIAAHARCLTGGPIGILDSGAVIFDALDASGQDAPAHEIVDGCSGHPAPGGVYHYHALPPCLATGSASTHSKRIGWAYDGFPIYGPRGPGGSYMRNANLDACHGHTHVISLDGRRVRLYHYHATIEYPYTLGCFRGTPVVTGRP